MELERPIEKEKTKSNMKIPLNIAQKVDTIKATKFYSSVIIAFLSLGRLTDLALS
jgi:hypothetical protein